MNRMRPSTSRVPCATWTRAPVFSGRPNERDRGKVNSASKRSVRCAASGAQMKSPGRTSSVDRPARLTATRLPAGALSTDFPCIWMERTRVLASEGMTMSSSPSEARRSKAFR